VGFELGRDQTADGNTLTQTRLAGSFLRVNGDRRESAESRLQQQAVDVQRFGKLWLGVRDDFRNSVTAA
jgi:hypothetical protein